MSRDVEDGNALSWLAIKRARVFTRDKHAMVGIAANISSHTHILHKKRYIAQGVVLTLARGSYDSDASLVLL